jgi:hypothetical protein
VEEVEKWKSGKVSCKCSRLLRWFVFAQPPMVVFVALMAIGFAAPSFSAAQSDHSCLKSDEMRAESEAGTLRNWTALYRSFLRYRQCDDGASSVLGSCRQNFTTAMAKRRVRS